MRQFKNNLKRNRGRNHSDRSFKRSSDIDKLNGNFANNDNSYRRKINRSNGNVQKLISKYNDLVGNAKSLPCFLTISIILKLISCFVSTRRFQSGLFTK